MTKNKLKFCLIIVWSLISPTIILFINILNSPQVSTLIYVYCVYFALKPPMTVFEFIVVFLYIVFYSSIYVLGYMRTDEQDWKGFRDIMMEYTIEYEIWDHFYTECAEDEFIDYFLHH